ncbi:J domain-containing protein [Desulfosarcina ovata]|uniref:J domain-containing protein n=1 Tax=Desulfosarcina ovata subsp. ovata TaxID=2752305 RepID=A0A5K8A5P8_9BACT|nr:J domain-containing protein [Desulfosarcina ovata]BBO87912.1 hypothetical protein DSCOOX_10920 [Desulfosarcina ovata subsp. ovata]
MDLLTSFKILGITPLSDADQAKHAYKAQVRRWHPDQFPEGSASKIQAEEQLKRINVAYARIRQHLATHRPDTGPTSDAEPACRPPKKSPNGHVAPEKKRKRSWMDHLFDALNSFSGGDDDAGPSAVGETDAKRQRRSFKQVLDEMACGKVPEEGSPSPRPAPTYRCRTTGYRQPGRQSNTDAVDGTARVEPIKPVGRVRGIGRNR